MNRRTSEACPRRFKHYPKYRDSGVEWLGDIPQHWRLQRLKTTVTECQNGVWGREPDGIHDVDCVRVADFDRVGLRVTATGLTRRSIEPRDATARRLRNGDLLLEKSGSGDKQPVGVVVLYDRDTAAVCSNFIARMPVEARFSPRFLAYVHASLYAARVNVRSIKQNTGIQNLDSGNYLAEFAAFPDIGEQVVIADFLDRETARIDALIAKNQRLIELLQNKRAAAATRAVTNGLDLTVPTKPSGVEWLGNVPARWQITPLKRILSRPLANGLFKKRDSFGSGTRLVNVTDIYRDDLTIDVSNLERVETESWEATSFEGRSGDVFIVRSSLKREGIGASAVLTATPEPVVFECHLVRARSDPTFTFGRYLVEYLNSLTVRQRLVAVSETTTMTTIGQSELANLEVAIPTLDEQVKALELIDAMRIKFSSIVVSIHSAIDLLTELRTDLISAAVTGKVDVLGEGA